MLWPVRRASAKTLVGLTAIATSHRSIRNHTSTEFEMAEPPAPHSANRAAIDEALTLLRELDNTRPDQMTPLYYAHGYWELWLALREVLRALGEEPPE